jgi:ornithine carbamoyltransferase
VQQDRDGTTQRRWSLSRAWTVKAPAIGTTRQRAAFVCCAPKAHLLGSRVSRNEADENVIESVTLSYDFFELVQ